MGSFVQLYSLAETPQPPHPAFGLIYEGAIGQSRETLPVDVLEEDKPGRLADVLEDKVRGKGEDDVSQIGT